MTVTLVVTAERDIESTPVHHLMRAGARRSGARSPGRRPAMWRCPSGVAADDGLHASLGHESVENVQERCSVLVGQFVEHAEALCDPVVGHVERAARASSMTR